MIKVGIVGGTGYTGAELLRLLSRHPQVTIAAITSRGEAGKAVCELFPNLRGHGDLAFIPPEEAPLHACDAVFFATPHGVAMTMAPPLLERGIRVIDLSADFRLKDPALFERWYGLSHAAPAWLSKAAYGLPEFCRETIAKARLVACPGCYPTAAALGLLPLIEAGCIALDGIIVDAKSGVSGAGRKASLPLLLAEAGESLKAYSVSGHRHLPEIRQTLEEAARRPVSLTFVPHLTPMIRGIHATLYARLVREADLQSLFEERYRKEPFVDVLPPGSHPETRSTKGSNMCRIGVHLPQGGETAVVLSVIDNLVKGAAGQAVQCMNLMFGMEETLGLEGIALLP